MSRAPDQAEVRFAIEQLRKGKPLDDLIEKGMLLEAEVDAAREQIREEDERRADRFAKEEENRARGGLSCRRCSGFVSAEDADRYGSLEDGYVPPYCAPCWRELERPLLEKRLRVAGVPAHFLTLALILGHADTYSRPRGKAFTLIVGPVGVGKTTRAVRMLLDVREGRFISLPDLVEMRREAMFGKDDSRPGDPLRDVATYRRLLILDEVGGKLTDGQALVPKLAADTFQYLVHHRYDHALPTVMTSNWTLEQLEEGYGEKVGSRLAESAHVVAIRETSDRRRPSRKHEAATPPRAETKPS